MYVGLSSFFAHRYDRAIEVFNQAVQLGRGAEWAIWMIGQANEERGDYSTAIESFRTAELAQGGKPELVKQKYDELREAYEKSNQEGYWEKKLEFAQQAFEGGGRLWQALDVAAVYAHLHNREMAFRWQCECRDRCWLSPGR